MASAEKRWLLERSRAIPVYVSARSSIVDRLQSAVGRTAMLRNRWT